jgi:hypothetical protein
MIHIGPRWEIGSWALKRIHAALSAYKALSTASLHHTIGLLAHDLCFNSSILCILNGFQSSFNALLLFLNLWYELICIAMIVIFWGVVKWATLSERWLFAKWCLLWWASAKLQRVIIIMSIRLIFMVHLYYALLELLIKLILITRNLFSFGFSPSSRTFIWSVATCT